MKNLSVADIAGLERRYRARLINSLSGFKSANLVGTISGHQSHNLSIVSSVVHFGANPPLIGFVMRPVTVTRDTYNNIMETGEFTLNHVGRGFFKEAHQTSARYPEETSEFSAVGLTPEFSQAMKAPYVAESQVKMGVQFKQKISIELNGTILILGEIVELIFPGNCLQNDGFLDIEQAGTVAVSGLDSYHVTQKLARLSYAKPDRDLEELA